MGEGSMTLMASLWQNQPVMNQTYKTNESRLVPTVAFVHLPWLLPALQQLEMLQNEGRNIPGIGDLRISDETGAVVRKLLTYIPNQYLPVPHMAPISGGGVAVAWNLLNREVSFRIFPRVQEILYMVTDERDEIIEDGTLIIGQKDRMNDALSYLASR
jgi:hypothetical protein